MLLCMVSLQAQTLLIYGGSDHDVFLGKLNADCYDSESIWNEYGTYGSKYSSKSIWNEYGTYGSEYSSYSPWNEYASTPPVVVDSRGNFYGYLTANEFISQRYSSRLVDFICRHYKQIRDDLSSCTTNCSDRYCQHKILCAVSSLEILLFRQQSYAKIRR